MERQTLTEEERLEIAIAALEEILSVQQESRGKFAPGSMMMVELLAEETLAKIK